MGCGADGMGPCPVGVAVGLRVGCCHMQNVEQQYIHVKRLMEPEVEG
jgi:hypothetical protein